MRVLFALLLCVVFGSSAVHAEDIAAAFDSLEVGTSARMIRIGNVEGFSDMSNTIFENPAGMYRIRKFSMSAFTTTFMDEVNYRSLSTAFRLPKGMLGFGVMGTGVDDIERTGEDSSTGEYNVQGYFGYRNYVGKLAYQYSFSRYLHLGVAGSYYHTSMHTVRGKGFNADVGLIIDSDKLDFSMTLKNVLRSQKINYTDTYEGTITDNVTGEVISQDELSSDGKQEELPFQTVYSLRYTLRHFQVFGQMKTVGSDRVFVKSVGVDFNPTFLPFFHISGGYKESATTRSEEGETIVNDIDGGFTMGLGLDLWGVAFDYAYEKSEHFEYDNKHYFSVGLSF